MNAVVEQIGTDRAALRPFRVDVPEAELTELRRRIKSTRLPDKEPVADMSQGVPIATIQKLAQYWATEYDWRKPEARLNSLPQFITEIDGLDIHFIHVRSKHPNALPIIVSHGWPGSFIEQLKIIGPLTDPTAFGGGAEDAFDVVIPSMPGYGFSGKPTATGWDPVRIAQAWIILMQRLGYRRYVAQGGDWGSFVVEMMAAQGPPELIGMHTNFPHAVPPDVSKAIQSGGPAPSGLSDDERRQFDLLKDFFTKGLAYALQMGLRPQTLYGIADSPVGLAAWMLDYNARSLELVSRAFDGEVTGLTRDDVLDAITLFWLTNSAISSARLYWENKIPFFDATNVAIPVAVSVFPDEIYCAPLSWAKRAYPNLIHYNKVPKGGHFAAWEQPQIFSEEVRAGFRSLRK